MNDGHLRDAAEMNHRNERVERMRLAIEGLSIGDAFGQRFFFAGIAQESLPARKLPVGPWYYTDDTEMALALAEVLEDRGQLDQDYFATILARRYQVDPHRGYGAGAHELLHGICEGEDWRTLNRQLFGGEGSYGNGAAMRVAPLAAYFADDVDRLIEQADASAEVTHSHPEGRAGAIAVALAAAWAWQHRASEHREPQEPLLEWVTQRVPESAVRTGILQAAEIDPAEDIRSVANQLGNGSRITAQDTVPFCMWVAEKYTNEYEEALWNTVSAGGDFDTNCAIIGGIIALSVGLELIPEEWRLNRESLWRYSAPP